MNRIARTLLVAASVAALAVGGCGVPGSGTPEDVGQAPGFGPPIDPRDVSLPEPGGAAGPEELVDRYLQAAAAGDWDPEVVGNQRFVKAAEHARKFLSDELKPKWQPSAEIRVVQVAYGVPSQNLVDVQMHVVGVLGENGALNRPSEGPTDLTHRFVVERRGDLERGGGVLRLTGTEPPPPYLLLSTTGLRSLFDVRPVYFWDSQVRNLVPDPRYLAKGVSRDKRIREVVDRLTNGPSDFLKLSVEIGLTANTFSGDNPVIDQSKIVVNLSATTSPNQSGLLARLASQLRWSLHPEKLPVELRIGGRFYKTFSGTDYHADNPAQRGVRPNQDERLYGVLGGEVVAAVPGSGAPPALDTPPKCDVVSAALNQSRKTGAYVCRNGSARELWLGRWDREPPGVTFEKVELPDPTRISRPSYVPEGRNRVLVASAGRLYDVDEDAGARRVEPPPDVGDVTAVSVAPDGRRVAFIANNQVFVATLDPRVPVRLGLPRLLETPGLTDLRGVAWSYEHQLVVATPKALFEVAVDNGHREPIAIDKQLGTLEITQVASMPVPWSAVEGGSPHGPLVVEAVAPSRSEANPQAYYVYPTEPRLVPIAAPRVGPSASPSTGPSQPVGSQPQLRAPFFLDGE